MLLSSTRLERRWLPAHFVVQGEGEGVVEAIGARTAIAGIAALTRQAHRPPSPLTVQLNRVVKIIAVIAIVTGTLLAGAGLALGLDATQAFLFGVGVSVALVPEGLLPTVTLSLARGASLMAERKALVRQLDAVETLGATTYICTDKTGALTQNRMAVVEVWDARRDRGSGWNRVRAERPDPGVERGRGPYAAGCRKRRSLRQRSGRAHRLWMGRRRRRDGSRGACVVASGWQRCDTGTTGSAPPRISRLIGCSAQWSWRGAPSSLGAPEAVLSRCLGAVPRDVVDDLAARGRRVLAVAEGRWRPGEPESDCETALRVLALIGFEGPPRPDVAEALAACRAADIKVAMVTGDHPGTAAAVAREVGLLGGRGVVLDASQLPKRRRRAGRVPGRRGGRGCRSCDAWPEAAYRSCVARARPRRRNERRWCQRRPGTARGRCRCCDGPKWK